MRWGSTPGSGDQSGDQSTLVGSINLKRLGLSPGDYSSTGVLFVFTFSADDAVLIVQYIGQDSWRKRWLVESFYFSSPQCSTFDGSMCGLGVFRGHSTCLGSKQRPRPSSVCPESSAADGARLILSQQQHEYIVDSTIGEYDSPYSTSRL